MKERINKIKAHLRENKKVYYVGTICFAAGATLVAVIATRNVEIVDKKMIQINWRSPGTNQIIHETVRRMHPGYIVQNVRTGEVWASQNAAADALGIPRMVMSSHLRGLFPNVDGEVYRRIGEATS